jgi:HEAT repeat protein
MRRCIPGVLVLWLVVAFTLPGADLEALIKQTKSKDADERRNAYKDLADAGSEAKVVVPVLLDGLKDPDKYVRRFAAQSLTKMEDLDTKKVLPILSRIAGDKGELSEVQEAVVGAMGKMGTGAVDPLAKVLKDTDKDLAVRRRAALSLGDIGPSGGKGSLTALMDVMNEKGDNTKKKGPPNLEGNIRTDAVSAMGKIATAKDEAVIKYLESLAAEKNKDKNFKATINGALKEIKARN